MLSSNFIRSNLDSMLLNQLNADSATPISNVCWSDNVSEKSTRPIRIVMTNHWINEQKIHLNKQFCLSHDKVNLNQHQTFSFCEYTWRRNFLPLELSIDSMILHLLVWIVVSKLHSISHLSISFQTQSSSLLSSHSNFWVSESDESFN